MPGAKKKKITAEQEAAALDTGKALAEKYGVDPSLIFTERGKIAKGTQVTLTGLKDAQNTPSSLTEYGLELQQRDQQIEARNQQNRDTLATRERNKFRGSQLSESTSRQETLAGKAGLAQTIATGGRGLLTLSRTRRRQLLGG